MTDIPPYCVEMGPERGTLLIIYGAGSSRVDQERVNALKEKINALEKEIPFPGLSYPGNG